MPRLPDPASDAHRMWRAILICVLAVATVAAAENATTAPATTEPTTTTAPTTATAPAEPTKTTVQGTDGSVRVGVLDALDAAGAHLRVDGQVVTVPIAELQEVRLGSAEVAGEPAAGLPVIRTRRGDRLVLGGTFSLAEGKLSLSTGLTGPGTLPLEAVDAILLPEPGTSADRADEAMRNLSLPSGTDDYLVVRSDGGELVPVAGALRSVSGGKVTFHYDGADRTIDLAKVLAIRIAPIGPAPKLGRGDVFGADGTRLAFDAAQLTQGRLELAGTSLGDLPADTAGALAVVFRSENVVFLADLEPAKAQQAGTFDRSWPYKRNASTLGGALRLGGRSYSRGLGLHSRCTLRYTLDGQFAKFVATAGIDERSPRGDATLTILVDDKPAVEAVRLVGQAKPTAVSVDLAAAKTLTILVDFGEGLDVGDHVDLADARLLKK